MRCSSRSLAAVACVVAVAGLAHDVAADDESIDDLLRRGVALRRQHRDEEALGVFQTILARAPTPSARAQVALAEQGLGRWVAAERDLDFALSADDDAWIVKNGAALQSARVVIEEHLAWMTVRVDVASAAITLAGASVAGGVETRVVAGAVVLDVRADGHIPAHRVVVVSPAEHAVATIAMVSLTPSIDPVDRAAPPLASPRTTSSPVATSASAGPIVLGGLGLAALATAAYFGVRTIDFKSERDGACTNGCLPAAANYDLDARSSAAASTAAFGVGAGFVAAGVVWWLVDRGRASATRPAVEVAPIVGACTGGLVVRGAL